MKIYKQITGNDFHRSEEFPALPDDHQALNAVIYRHDYNNLTYAILPDSSLPDSELFEPALIIRTIGTGYEITSNGASTGLNDLQAKATIKQIVKPNDLKFIYRTSGVWYSPTGEAVKEKGITIEFLPHVSDIKIGVYASQICNALRQACVVTYDSKGVIRYV